MEKCRRMKRPQFMSKNWIYSWQWMSSRIRQQFYRQESFAMNTDTHTSGSTVKNHISFKTVFGYSAIQRTSFRSWFQACQRVLPQACPLQHPWHLQGRKLIIPRLPQARFTSPTMTSSTVSSDSVTRQARRDLCGIDSYPVTVSSKHVERQERWDFSSGTPEEELLTKPTKNPKPKKKQRPRSRTGRPVPFRNTGMAARIQWKPRGWQSSWTQRLTRQFFSWTIFRAHVYEKCGFG